METLKLIGNTPVYHMEDTNIYVKLEKFNAGGSIKDRAVMGMLQHAIDTGEIKEDSVLIEATSGNTGIALAMLGAVYHIPTIILMPETMSEERRQMIKAYGAELILTQGALGMQGSIDKMKELMDAHPNYVALSQFDNPYNPQIHYETTGKEILAQVPDVDIFVACVGTGGTFSGISRRLKEANPNIRCVAGEPKSSALISGHEAGPHKIQGIGANFIPKNFDEHVCDDVMMVSDEDALAETVAFAKTTGILVGISSGANIALAKRLEKYYPDKTIVTIAPDGGEKYLSVLEF
ncbi:MULTISPECIES: cysteine synthase A [Bacillota]|jgi:cysteine synthase|uniref:Cysteine synthase A n=1 Tax=Amedibacillus hominis TaxID=2897776 RepID=A0ABS9R9A1_9FIRM|nr:MULTISPECIES: cysteine synthase A [Bacillota]MCH4286232.1 cysteine synthase A [Amedibacillus hominis]RGB53269.1 cysteine synthase A [Absiella sp. AM22-9]RGB55955.1 cysteine synthase A [Absiella sp. AM10-20]RGB63997.1 cysteine synthase A [Absiella sp. AM09-45]RGB76978.1 cysteine synthase A [Absiella sp. AM09-50]